MATTYRKLGEVDQEMSYEVIIPQPSTKRTITIAQIDMEIEMNQNDINRATKNKLALEQMKTELLKL